MMMERAKSVGHWLIAGLIATVIASVSLSYLLPRQVNKSHDSQPCSVKPCFIALDKRLGVVEAEIKIRTANRYTSQDAERDHRIMQSEMSKMQKEIAVLRERLRNAEKANEHQKPPAT